MISNISHHLVHVTEQAALACHTHIWSGERKEADAAATEAMRDTFNALPLSVKVVIGEGERDEAPMLYIWEELGTWWTEIDIAVDPLEGTNLCAKNRPWAIAVLAAWPRGSLMHAPDTYMNKIVVWPKVTTPISLDNTVAQNIDIIAGDLGLDNSEVHVAVIDRKRSQQLITDIRATGAKVKLISDGDVIEAITVLMETSSLHAMMWIGAAPESVITAVAVKALGGQLEGCFMPYNDTMTIKNEDVCTRMKDMWVEEERIYTVDDLVRTDDCVFVASWVTTGAVLEWTQYYGDDLMTDTLVISTAQQKIQKIQTVHRN